VCASTSDTRPFVLFAQSPIPNAIEVLLESTRKICGVIDHDEAKLLAPILDRCFPDKLTCWGAIVSNNSHPRVVRVHFQAQSSIRRISKFELQPIERQIKYYLKGRKALIPDTTSRKPPPVTPASAMAAVKTGPAAPSGAHVAGAASYENRINGVAASAAAVAAATTPVPGAHPLPGTHVGDWTCFVSVTTPSLTLAEGASAELVREPENVRTNCGAVAPTTFLRSLAGSLAHPHLSTPRCLRQHNDRNAIRVDCDGTSIGYVRSTEASKLAPMLDVYRVYLHWTCKIPSKGKGPLRALIVSFYCREISLAGALQGHLKRRLPSFSASIAPAPSRGPRLQEGGGAKAPRSGHDFLSTEAALMSQIVASSLELSEQDWLEQKDALDEMFDQQSRSQLASLPEYPMPALFARNKVKLFRHQIAGIRWLVHQEKQDLPSYLECEPRHGRTGWRCKITKTRFANKPQGMKGGILADDMGLGAFAEPCLVTFR
jgi:hypothetical protein